jgi:hypothetical protein
MIGLANPLGLLTLASVAVLIALTQLRRRSRISAVSSLLLWKQLPARPLERQRFRPDLLFVLRLLLLLALVAGYALPWVGRPGGDAEGGLAIVLDVSASMQVREAGGSRFGLARRRLDELVAALPSAAPVMLVAAADRPRVALRWTVDRGRLAERLAALEPLDTPTAIAPAVELALGEAGRRSGARVAVLTDLPPAASALPPARLAGIDWIAIGRRDDNLAITGLTVDAPPFAEAGDVRVEVEVRNFGSASRATTLEATLDGKPWTRQAFALAARGTGRASLGAPPGPGLLRVRIAPDDALAVDNEAVAWVPSQPPLDVLLVTESDALGAAFRALVATVPRGHLEVVNRAGLAERAGLETVDGLVTVFDHQVPTSDDGAGSVLYLAPPPGNAVCPGARTVEDASVVDWEPGAPVLQGFGSLAAVEAARATQLLLPPWGTAAVTAASRRAAFPFLVVGERAGRRRACLGAELPAQPSSSDAMPLVLLTLGTLRWLAEPAAETPITLATGVPVRAAGAALRSADGVRASGDPPVVLAERAGIHRLEGAGGADRLVLASLLSADESDVGRDGGGERPATAAPASAPSTSGRRDLSWWFYVAAAALLALEWAVWGLVG